MGIKDLAEGRAGDCFKLPLDCLRICPDDFIRLDFGDISELARSLADKGQEEPMTVRVAREGDTEVAYVTNGCRRFKAMLYANDKLEAKIIHAICKNEPKGTNDEERVLIQFRCNDTKPFTALETGIGFQRLIKAGWSVVKIANEAKKSKTHVSNCLALAEDPEAIKDAVRSGKIKPATALELRKADPQTRQTALLKADLGQKVTGKSVKDSVKEMLTPPTPKEFDPQAFVDGLIKLSGFEMQQPNTKYRHEIRINSKDPGFIAVLGLR